MASTASPRRALAAARISRSTRSWTAAGAVAIAVLATIVPVGSAAGATPGDLPVGSAPQRPAGVSSISPAPSDARISFNVVLAPRDPAGLEQFVTAVSTPGSPQYRHYLPPGAFGPRFGASPAVIKEVSAALRARGLEVGAAAPNALSIPVSGSVAQISAAFRTSFKSYRLRSGRTGLANVSAPMFPASVARQVQGVVGLNQLTHAIARDGAAAAALQPAAAAPTACPTAASAATGTGAYTPAQLAHHYGLDALYPTTTGQGATVALFELEPFAASDVAAYQSCFATHTPISVRTVDGGAGVGAGSGEAALDIEMVIGLAPSANILVYEAPNDGASVYDEFRQIAVDDTAQVVSDSWGLCEAESGVAGLAALERPLFQQMAAQGQTVLAATGDSGSEGCFAPPDSSDTSLSIWEPASQPEVTAVGGTSIASIDAADTSWSNGFGATGGGISTLWPMPSYQRALGTVPESTGAPCGAPAGQLCRETPDVSASADVEHGSLAFFNNAWHAIGGTSAAAPAWGALVALIDASCPAGSVGFMNPALYQLAGSSALVDVKTGPDNDYTGTNGGAYPTRAGFDLTTGLGRPSAAPLASGLCPAVGTAGSGTMSVDPPLVSTSTTVTLTFTYTPDAATHGMVDGELDLTVPGTWTLPTTTSTNEGYTTASAGVVSVVGNTIVVKGITLPAGKSVTITYGDTSGGAQGALTPSLPQATVFSARSRTGKTGATAPLAISPAVRVVLPGGAGNGQAMLTRVAGADRIGTSVAASRTGFPSDNSADAVVIASANSFADAMTGVPLTVQEHAPLLLSTAASLDPRVVSEIQRVLPIGGRVFILGGTAVLSPAIDAQLQLLGYVTQRVQGPTRYDTAVKVAGVLGDPSTIFEVDGSLFPDALSSGPAAAITRGAILFTNGHSPAAATQVYLAAHPGDIRYALGPSATADPSATPFVGADRYATSAMIAKSFFSSPSAVGVASGTVFPDALSGAPVAARAGGPLILVPPTGALPTMTQSYLASVADSVLTAWLFGGTAAVNTAIANQVAQSLVLVPPAN